MRASKPLEGELSIGGFAGAIVGFAGSAATTGVLATGALLVTTVSTGGASVAAVGGSLMGALMVALVVVGSLIGALLIASAGLLSSAGGAWLSPLDWAPPPLPLLLAVLSTAGGLLVELGAKLAEDEEDSKVALASGKAEAALIDAEFELSLLAEARRPLAVRVGAATLAPPGAA